MSINKRFEKLVDDLEKSRRTNLKASQVSPLMRPGRKKSGLNDLGKNLNQEEVQSPIV